MLSLFANTCESLLNESGSINKINIISDSILKIQDELELYLFCVFLTGNFFPTSVQKTINVGKALIRDAVINLANIDIHEWNKFYREYGEIGDTVFEILSKINTQKNKIIILENTFQYNPKSNLTLNFFYDYINKLSSTSGNILKTNIITELLSQISPIEAKFVVKILLQNLRIGVQEATVEAAIAKSFEVDKKIINNINFYLGDIGEVALRAKNKNFDNIEFKLFHPIKAMLASAEVDINEIFRRMGPNTRKGELIDENNQSEVWCEYKYDGIRAHIHKQNNRVEIFTRDLKRITDQFPEIVEFYLNLKIDNFLIDGEIVPFNLGKIQPFAFIQKRLGRKENLTEEAKNNPTIFIAYDFLYFKNQTLFDRTLIERRELLENVFANCGQQFSKKKIVAQPSELKDFFVESKKEGREGLMIKKSSSLYEPGKRGINWLKYKETLDPLDVVIIQAEYGEGKNSKYLSSFTFGVWDETKQNILPIGRVASGMTEEDLKYFTKVLPEISIEKIENGYRVLPKEILEVGFENIQQSDRYISGWAVRFPRVERIRTNDKPLDEINNINDVKNIYESIKGLTTN